MNILVIGNGFDLAHGLPTKYSDFLDFIEVIIQVINIKDPHNIKRNWVNLDFRIANQLRSNMEDLTSFEKRWKELVDDNIWFEYFIGIFQERIKNGKENWIDFECEISNIIRILDNEMASDSVYLGDSFIKSSYKFLNEKFFRNVRNCKRRFSTYKWIRDILLIDLNKLISALEIYLVDYIETLDCKLTSPDIQWILSNESIRKCVLTFNYTNTYERLYKRNSNREIDFDYIHGEAYKYNIVELNNMVLGIDEYLPDDRKDKDTDFIAFKKYYQRIYKGTGCKYKEWVDEIKEDWENESEESKTKIRKCISRGDLKNEKIHNLYIFGHSLDATDKDVLRDLILNDNVHTTIFYHSKDELGRKIANLVKVIGQDELIRRTGGSTKTIDFKEQQKMQERD